MQTNSNEKLFIYYERLQHPHTICIYLFSLLEYGCVIDCPFSVDISFFRFVSFSHFYFSVWPNSASSEFINTRRLSLAMTVAAALCGYHIHTNIAHMQASLSISFSLFFSIAQATVWLHRIMQRLRHDSFQSNRRRKHLSRACASRVGQLFGKCIPSKPKCFAIFLLCILQPTQNTLTHSECLNDVWI